MEHRTAPRVVSRRPFVPDGSDGEVAAENIGGQKNHCCEDTKRVGDIFLTCGLRLPDGIKIASPLFSNIINVSEKSKGKNKERTAGWTRSA